MSLTPTSLPTKQSKWLTALSWFAGFILVVALFAGGLMVWDIQKNRTYPYHCEVVNLGIATKSFVFNTKSQADAVSHCLKITENWGKCNCIELDN